ncbi:unnamed protein product [Linum tenue]|uniref:BED-type domain-containing protein n=1 Tax=Linum tenue TaxID=586396 RepID=A0AAV0P9G7_9ROSI|nr:unnamed protein product [Linum tenue]
MVQLMAPFRSSTSVDPGWEHGIAQDDRKKKVKCNYCGKIVSGGIYRLKQHLARVSGEVTYCDKAPEDVYLKMKQNLDGSRSSRKSRLTEDEGQTYLNLHYEDDEDLAAPAIAAAAASAPVGQRTKGKQLMATNDRSLAVNFTPPRLGYVDPGWEHGVAEDERKKKVKCNYCDKVVSGGINRFKQHLARIPGEVAPCRNAPEEVYLKIKENMKWHRTGKRQRQLDSNGVSSFCEQSDEEEDEQDQDALVHLRQERSTVGEKRLRKDWKMGLRGTSPVGGSESFQKKSRLDSIYLNSSNNQPPPPSRLKVKNGWSRRSRRDVVSSICKFFYQAGVPIEAANSQSFHRMLELVCQYGDGLVGPRSQVISGRFLQEEIATIKEHLLEYKASWAITGCSILADSWIDVEGRTLINLLVSCPIGVYFVASVDGSDIVEDALSLFRVLDKVVEEMGEENVVQVITDNTPSYKAAGKMLEERRNLFWTPCATYCINQMLEEFLKIKCVEECIIKGQTITKLIYNRIWLLNLLKEFTQGQELLRIGATPSASSFATLQCLLDLRTNIRRMFQSSKWVSSGISQSEEGKEVEKIVSNANFWKKVQCICKSVEPITQVLRKVHSGESPSIPFIYNDLHRAKLAIKSIHGDDACKYGPFWSVLDNHWNSLLCHPLHLAAYFLNPSFRYCSEFAMHSGVMRGLNDSILRLEPDNLRRISASRQIPDYNSAKGDFGTELAISTRTELDPAAWWQQHGISCLELQRVAVRILSQTCSSFGCEHWWSIYDQIHIRRQNRLSKKQLDDLIFVHYNSRLRELQSNRSMDGSISVDSLLAEHLLGDWIVDAERHGVGLFEDEGVENGIGGEDGDEKEMLDYFDGEGEKETHEMVNRGDVNPPDAGADGCGSTDEEEDENFLNEDLSDEIRS